MVRYFLHPAAGVAAACLLACTLGAVFLPATLIGLPTPIVMLGAACAAILAAARYL